MRDIEGLQTLGLTQYEAKIYHALVKLKSTKVAAIAVEAGIPVPHAYAALHRLMGKGMVTGNHGKKKTYSAVAPALALTGLHKQAQEQVRAQAQLIKSLSTLYRKQPGPDEPPPFFQVLRTTAGVPGMSNVDRAREMRRAKHEILALAKLYRPALAHKAQAGALLDKAELAALRKGVKVRCVVEASVYDDPGEPERQAAMVRAGEHQRVAKELPMTLTIVDREKVWFESADYREKGVSFRINDRVLGEAFAAAFEYYWEHSQVLSDFLKSWSPRAAREKAERGNP